MRRGAGAREAGATGEGVQRATVMRLGRDASQSEARMSRGAWPPEGGRGARRKPGSDPEGGHERPVALRLDSGRTPIWRWRPCFASPAAAREAGATGEGVQRATVMRLGRDASQSEARMSRGAWPPEGRRGGRRKPGSDPEGGHERPAALRPDSGRIPIWRWGPCSASPAAAREGVRHDASPLLSLRRGGSEAEGVVGFSERRLPPRRLRRHPSSFEEGRQLAPDAGAVGSAIEKVCTRHELSEAAA
jgi:hypothetical protein